MCQQKALGKMLAAGFRRPQRKNMPAAKSKRLKKKYASRRLQERVYACNWIEEASEEKCTCS